MLKGPANVIAAVAIALWLGGTVALLAIVQRLFAFDREAAARMAPVLFIWFERYQIVLAGIAVFTLALSGTRQRLLVTLIPAILAAIIAVVSTTIVTPRIDVLRQMGEASTPLFRTLHGVSMCLYVMQVIALLLVIIGKTWGTEYQSKRTKRSTYGVQS